MLKNYMEEMTDLWIPRIFADDPKKYTDVCRCPACMARIRVETLNRVKPFYVTGKEGEVFGEYKLKESQYKMDLMVAITTAIEIVRHSAHAKAVPPEKPTLDMLSSLRKRKGVM